MNTKPNRLRGSFALNYFNKESIRVLRHERNEVELGHVPATGHNPPAQRFHLSLDSRRVGNIPGQMMSATGLPNTSTSTHHTLWLVVFDEFQQHRTPTAEVLQGVIGESHLVENIEPQEL